MDISNCPSPGEKANVLNQTGGRSRKSLGVRSMKHPLPSGVTARAHHHVSTGRSDRDQREDGGYLCCHKACGTCPAASPTETGESAEQRSPHRFYLQLSHDDECPVRTTLMDGSAPHSLLPSTIRMRGGTWAALHSISSVHSSPLPFITRLSVTTSQFGHSYC